MSRVSVFTKDGFYMGDLRVNTKRSYTLARTGVVGQCEFSISTLDVHARRQFLQFGMYLLVREAHLPDWCGVIYTPRSWRFGSLVVRAYQAEKILEWRATPTQKMSGNAGSIFRQILHTTNAARNNDKPITPGLIFEDGNYREETLGNDAFAHIVSVAKRSNQDFEVAYQFDANGRLVLTGNWYERKGVDTGKFFREGFNMEAVDNVMEEVGDLWNDITGLSDASSANTRLAVNKYYDVSIAEHGLYQKSIVFSGVTQQATLDQNTLETLKRTIEPIRSFDIQALNVGGAYDYLNVGNFWNVDMNYEGFTGNGFGSQAQVQILGMEREDGVERVRIISEVQYANQSLG